MRPSREVALAFLGAQFNAWTKLVDGMLWRPTKTNVLHFKRNTFHGKAKQSTLTCTCLEHLRPRPGPSDNLTRTATSIIMREFLKRLSNAHLCCTTQGSGIRRCKWSFFTVIFCFRELLANKKKPCFDTNDTNKHGWYYSSCILKVPLAVHSKNSWLSGSTFFSLDGPEPVGQLW